MCQQGPATFFVALTMDIKALNDLWEKRESFW
jgi:hypothetical protein